MAHFQIKNRWTNAVIYEGEAETLGDLVATAVKNGAILDGALLVGASMVGASMVGARLDGARLDGARLDDAILDHASMVGARLDDAILDHASMVGARLDGAILDRASMVGASMVGASMVGASMVGARLDGARLKKGEIVGLVSLSGLYRYHITAYVLKEGLTPCVKMGCLDFTLNEWKAKGIAESNASEFPNDGSYRSMQRIRAFDYACAEALAILEKYTNEAKK